jgi:hypothetical protein
MLSYHPPYRRQLPLLETLEDYDVPWRSDLTPGAPRVKNGFYQLPTGPGWDVEIDEAVIAAHPEDPNAKLNIFRWVGSNKCAGEWGWRASSEF